MLMELGWASTRRPASPCRTAQSGLPTLPGCRARSGEALSEKERQEFAPVCPDFVVELRSPSDSLRWLKAKMEEYIANGAHLGWLIDPLERTVYVYRPGAEPERLENPSAVSGDPILRGLSLSLDRIW